VELGDRFEEVRIEHLGAVAAVEAFDVRVLIRLARLDLMNCHAVRRAPIDEALSGEFRSVVDAHGGGPAVHRDQLVEGRGSRADSEATGLSRSPALLGITELRAPPDRRIHLGPTAARTQRTARREAGLEECRCLRGTASVAHARFITATPLRKQQWAKRPCVGARRQTTTQRMAAIAQGFALRPP
jgi:hypothetical protein